MVHLVNMKQNKVLPIGTIIGFSSTFNWKQWASWKHLRTKPFHYGIQGFTGSDLDHVASICNSLYEAMGKTGVRKMLLKERIEETDSVVKIYTYEPMVEFTEKQSDIFKASLESQLGKKFNGIQAMFAALDRLIFFNLFKSKPKNKTTFCSKYVFIAYQDTFPDELKGIIPRTLSPEECIKLLRKKRLIRGKKLLNKANYK